MSNIDSLSNRVELTNLCIAEIKKIVAETEKINDQEIHTSLKNISEAVTHFKIEVGNLRVKILYNYSPGKYGETGQTVER